MTHILWRLSERRKNNGRAPLGAKARYTPAIYYTLGLIIDFQKKVFNSQLNSHIRIIAL